MMLSKHLMRDKKKYKYDIIYEMMKKRDKKIFIINRYPYIIILLKII